MKSVDFLKMAGAGNDFIVIDARKLKIASAATLAKKLCDRKHSIGGDGLLLVEKSSATIRGGSASGGKKADMRMRIINPDGSEAEMCGNGVRCVAKFAVVNGITGKKLSIETLAGIIQAEVKGDIVKARMIDPKTFKTGLRLSVNGEYLDASFIDTGVPHAVVYSNALETLDVETIGRAIRTHECFAPRGANANFIAKTPSGIRVRTYERGVEGETLACGTGSTASALIAAATQGLSSPVSVRTQGGEILKIYFSRKNGVFHDVYLEGSVKTSFEGRVEL